MKKSRFSEEKIISILKELEAGAKATELARKYGVSDVTIYNWTVQRILREASCQEMRTNAVP